MHLGHSGPAQNVLIINWGFKWERCYVWLRSPPLGALTSPPYPQLGFSVPSPSFFIGIKWSCGGGGGRSPFTGQPGSGWGRNRFTGDQPPHCEETLGWGRRYSSCTMPGGTGRHLLIKGRHGSGPEFLGGPSISHYMQGAPALAEMP
jgi:hypothetical protein